MYEYCAMFNLNYVATALGVPVESGGLSLYESGRAGETVAVAGQVTLTNTPIAYDGSMIGWYKKPSDANWSVATITGTTMNIPGAQIGETYCIKYFYNNVNARSITIKAQYVPSVLHIVIINDMYSGDVADVGNAERYGRLITDIPRFQLDGSQNLALNATTPATVSLTGSALAVDTGDSCEEDLIYGTMTEEIFGAVWQDNVVALAPVDSEIEMEATDTYTIGVYAVFGGNTASRLINDNSDLTFAIETTPASTTSNVEVGAHTGVITTTSATPGNCVISVSLNDHDDVPPALISLTIN